MKIKVIPLAASIILCLSVGFVGSFFTISSIPTWYATLNKPAFSPPNYIFGPVWTVLYILMGIAFYNIWIKGLKKKEIKIAVNFFLIQLLLNFLWSIIFFGLHLPALAFVDIILLWIAIVITMIKFYKLSKPTLYLFLPYIAWVSFAAILNLSIALLNM